METSLAIHPEKFQSTEVSSRLRDIGALKTYQKHNEGYLFTCENGFVSLLFYTDKIVRIIMNPKEVPQESDTLAVIEKPTKVRLTIEDQKSEILFATDKVLVKIRKNPLRITFLERETDRVILAENQHGGMHFGNKGELICYKSMEEKDRFYGFGEKTGSLDKRGTKMTMWNTDVYSPHNPETDPLYQSIPFFLTLRDGNSHGIFFNNSWKTVFDLKSDPQHYSFSAEGGQLDYYFFAGPHPKDVIKQYTYLTGRIPMPAKWTLGYHQSRYSYKTEQEVKELVDTFQQKEIPLDAVYLDIHYMDGYRVFTIDRDRFPNFEEMVQDLLDQGIRVVPIIDPGVKVDPHYKVYLEGIERGFFCKDAEGTVFKGDVWPGTSVFPDYSSQEVQKWWGDLHKELIESGIEGIWNDMNEPSVFNESKTINLDVIHQNDGDPKTHQEMHNLYGLQMVQSTYNGLKRYLNNRRPFVLTRAGFSGIQRYAAVWTGDNRSFWEHMQLSIPMCLNLGLSGVAIAGSDVGGFAFDTSGEMLARWMQLGAFLPFFRNHSEIGSIHQEPWVFGEKFEKVIKEAIEERYRWLPHLYSLVHEASKTGLPVIRPLMLEYPGDSRTHNLSDQFLLGESILIAPIMSPDTEYRMVYLPDGRWINQQTGEILEGNKHIIVHAPLDVIPIFIKEGSVRVEANKRLSTNHEISELLIHIYPKENEETRFIFYDDDGITFDYEKGICLQEKITCFATNEYLKIQIQPLVSGYHPSYKKTLLIHHTNPDKEIILNDQKVMPDKVEFHEATQTITVEL